MIPQLRIALFLRRFAAVAAALSLLVTAASAGGRYYYCLHAATTHRKPCCPAAQRAQATSAAEAERRAEIRGVCCEQHEVPGAGARTAHTSPAAAPDRLPVATEVGWLALIDLPSLAPAVATEWPIRAGPGAALERCAVLQVFLS